MITIPNGNLTVLPPDVDTLKKQVDSKLSEVDKKLADFEARFSKLSAEIGHIGMIDRDNCICMTSRQLITEQAKKGTSNGYYEIPFNCYIETLHWSLDSTIWINPPNNNPEAYYLNERQKLINEGRYNATTLAALFASMNKWVVSAGVYTAGLGSGSTFAYKGDKLKLTWDWNNNYRQPWTSELGKWTEYANSLSYIKLYPMSKQD